MLAIIFLRSNDYFTVFVLLSFFRCSSKLELEYKVDYTNSDRLQTEKQLIHAKKESQYIGHCVNRFISIIS